MRARFLFLLCALTLSHAASAPLGTSAVDRLEKFPALGFGFERSARLEARQVPPDAVGLLLMFAPKGAPADRAAPSTQRVYRLDEPDVGTVRLRSWAQGLFPTASLDEARFVRHRYGRAPVRLTGEHIVEEQRRALFIHAWVGQEDAVIFVGECEEAIARREQRAFERAAGSFKFFEQVEVDRGREKWEARYKRTVLPFEAERIEIGTKLADGWTVTDTQSAMVLFHGREQSEVPAQLASGLMAVRRRLKVDLPADEAITSLAVVRICRDRGEYLTYGGSPATVGYFNPGVGELVLYDARVDPDGPIPLDHPTARTLYHEVCHQYLHQVMSAASPHTWFGEGLAEYYAGANIRSGRVAVIDALEGQLLFLRRPEVQAMLPPLDELLRLPKSAFYANAAVCYPYSYALVRFLESSPEVRARQPWRSLLRRYFEALRGAWRAEVREMALRGISRRSYELAIARSQQAALDSALEGVDIPELERAVREWIARGEG